MRRSTFVLTFVCSLSNSPLAAQAADDSTDRLTLKGITAFHAAAIITEDIPSSASIQASLQTLVELCLRRDGIRIIQGAAYGPSVVFTASMLRAQNRGGTQLGYATAWSFEVRQSVRTDSGAWNYVATWHYGKIDVNTNDSLEGDLTRDVEQGCTAFSNAFLTVNPISR